MSFKNQSLSIIFIISLAVFSILPNLASAQKVESQDDMLQKIRDGALEDVLAEYKDKVEGGTGSGRYDKNSEEYKKQQNDFSKASKDLEKLFDEVKNARNKVWDKINTDFTEWGIKEVLNALEAESVIHAMIDGIIERIRSRSSSATPDDEVSKILDNYLNLCQTDPQAARELIKNDRKNKPDGWDDFMQSDTSRLSRIYNASDPCTAKPGYASRVEDERNGRRTAMINLVKETRKKLADIEGPMAEYTKKLKEYEDAKFNVDAMKSSLKGCVEWYYIMLTDKDGKNPQRYNFCKTKNGDFIAESGVSMGCMPLPLKLAEFKQCIFCPLFLMVYNASNAIGINTFNTTAGPISNVLLLAFAIYIAFKTMVMVSGFTKQDSAKYITEMLIQSFKILLAYLVLTNVSTISQFIISPILGAGLEFGTAMLSPETQKHATTCMANFEGTIDGRFLGRTLYIKLECFIQGLENEISIMKAIGSTLMCISRKAAATHYSSSIATLSIPDFGMMIQGLIIYIFSWLLLLAFSFYLIDATVRIGIVAALVPFLVAAWPFEQTTKYSSTGWTMIMNTFFTYVFMGIVIKVNLELAMRAISNGQADSRAMMDLINGNDIDQIKEIMDIGGTGLLILIGCCLFGFKLTGKAGDLADQMAGGGGAGGGIATKIATTGVSAATEIARKAGSSAKDGIKSLAAGKGVNPGDDKKDDDKKDDTKGEESSKQAETKQYDGNNPNEKVAQNQQDLKEKYGDNFTESSEYNNASGDGGGSGGGGGSGDENSNQDSGGEGGGSSGGSGDGGGSGGGGSSGGEDNQNSDK